MLELIQNLTGTAFSPLVAIVGFVVLWMLALPFLIYAINLAKLRHKDTFTPWQASDGPTDEDEAGLIQHFEADDFSEPEDLIGEGEPDEEVLLTDEGLEPVSDSLLKGEELAETSSQLTPIDDALDHTPPKPAPQAATAPEVVPEPVEAPAASATESRVPEDAQKSAPESVETADASSDEPVAPTAGTPSEREPAAVPAAMAPPESSNLRITDYEENWATYSSEEEIIYDNWGYEDETFFQETEQGVREVAGLIEGSGYSKEEEVIYDDWDELPDAETPVETPDAEPEVAPVAAEQPVVPDESADPEAVVAPEPAGPVELDPYPDVELPDEEEEVAAEPIAALHEIDLSTDGKFHEHQYRYFVEQFHANLEDWTHERPRVGLAFLPGPDDTLERNVMPQLFWKPAALYEERRYRQADHIMPELYFHALRKPHFMPVTDSADRTVYMHLVNYALWRDKPEWIFNLAAFFDENRVPGDDLFLLAACLARVAKKENLAGYYFQRARDKNRILHGAYVLLKGDDAAARELVKQPDLPAEDFAWLGWLYAGYTGDRGGERKVLARMGAGEDVVSVLDLFGALLMRGRLFLAGRLLLKHRLLGQHSDAGLRAVLKLYFRNGKYLLYLNRLEKSPRWPGRMAWFEVHFCLHRLGGEDQQGALFRRITAGKDYFDLPEPSEQEEFLEEMRDPRLRASRLEIQEIHYHHDIVNIAALLSATEKIPVFRRASQDAEQKRIEKVYAVIQYILEEDLPLDRLELYLRAMSGALLLRPGQLPENLFQRLRSLSGRNLTARMLVGLIYFERGDYHEAIDYLEICQIHHPLVEHRMAEMLLAEKRLWEAEEAYRKILRFFPDEPIFHYNLGVILEKNGRPRGARQSLETAIALNPNFKAARNRLAKLKLQQPAIL